MTINKQLEKYLADNNVEFFIEPIGWTTENHQRKVYRVTFKKGNQETEVKFKTSLYDSYILQYRRPNGSHVRKPMIQVPGCKAVKDKVASRSNPIYPGVKVVFNKDDRQGQAELVDSHYIPPIADILSCTTGYIEPYFDDFCDEFGYDNDSIKAQDLHRACVTEYRNMVKVFGEDGVATIQELLQDY